MTRRRAFWSVLLASQSARAQQDRIPPDRLKLLTPILLRRQAQVDAILKRYGGQAAFHQPRPVFFLKDPAEWEHDSPACGPFRTDPVPVPPPRQLS